MRLHTYLRSYGQLIALGARENRLSLKCGLGESAMLLWMVPHSGWHMTSWWMVKEEERGHRVWRVGR